MKKILFTLVLLSSISTALEAQKYITREGYVRFFSTTPVEDIEAVNIQMSSILDASTSQIVFQVPIKAFKFEKALMQEHFNENYMESDKIPNASFKGEIADMPKMAELSEDGAVVEVKGKLSIHGVTKDVSEKFSLTDQNGKVTLQGKFLVSPKDYEISIPGAVNDKIADNIEVSIKAEYSEK